MGTTEVCARPSGKLQGRSGVSANFSRGAELRAWSLKADEGLRAFQVEEIASAKVGRVRKFVQGGRGSSCEGRKRLG